MKKLIAGAAVSAVLAWSQACRADSAFAGTWSMKPDLTTWVYYPLVFKIDNGLYKRTSCANQIQVPADGKAQPVSNEVYFDAIRVRVVDRASVEISETKADRVTWKGVYKVSKDLRSMTLKYTSDRAPVRVTGVLTFARQGDVIAGAHATSGEWQPTTLSDVSASGLRVTFKDLDNGLSMTAADGRSFEAPFDHQDHPLLGDVDGATVRVGHMSPRVIQINLRQDHSITGSSRVTVADDGNSLEWIDQDIGCHEVPTYTFARVPD